MMDVPATTMPTFDAEVPQRLFEGRFEKIGWGE
jgi:hypothetical protein